MKKSKTEGVLFMFEKFTEQQLRQLHAKGLTVPEIATKLGTDRETVRWHLRRLGLAPNPYKVVCAVCGKQFQSRLPHARYCSNECKYQYINLYGSQPKLTKDIARIKYLLEELLSLFKCPYCKKKLEPDEHSDTRLRFYCKNCGKRIDNVWKIQQDIRYIKERITRICAFIPELAEKIEFVVSPMSDIFRKSGKRILSDYSKPKSKITLEE